MKRKMCAAHSIDLCNSCFMLEPPRRSLDRSEGPDASSECFGVPLIMASFILCPSSKRGEKKVVSEWEKLEERSKNDLVIELMYWKTLYSVLRNDQDDACSMPMVERSDSGTGFSDFDPGEIATDSWAEKIALFAMAHPRDSEFWPCDLMDYGLTDQQSYDVCKRLLDKGILLLPAGVALRRFDNRSSSLRESVDQNMRKVRKKRLANGRSLRNCLKTSS